MSAVNPKSQKTRHVNDVPWWMYPVLFPLVMLIRIWLMTLRIHVAPGEIATYQAVKGGRLIIFWHNRVLISADLHRRFSKPRKMNGIISASKDGSWLAAFFKMLGIGAVRGSSSWRGGASMLGLIKCLEAGEDIAITPDGPRGPCYSMKTGAAQLARKTGATIFLVHSRYYHGKRLGSWDGFYLPRPFSRVDLSLEPITPDSEIAQLPIESFAKKIREQLIAKTDDSAIAWVPKRRRTDHDTNPQS